MTALWNDRTAAATGPAAVVAIFVGNGLNTAGVSTSSHPTGAQVLADVGQQSTNVVNQTGLVLELAGFLLLMVFGAHLYDVLRRRSAFTGSGVLALSALVSMLVVKLASGAPVLALAFERDRLSPDIALALNAMNGAAFVLSWLPFAVFVGAAAMALRASGHIGRVLHVSGIVLGVAGVALGLLGSVDLNAASPLAFLLDMVWTVSVGAVLTVRPDRVAGVTVRPALTEPLPA